MSTFLSAGIITGLLNHMQNNPDFWKRLDGYAGQYLKTAPIEADRVAMQAELRRLMEEFRSKTLVPKVNMESYQH
jgi:hypothetical protein